jgi:hypothetical protein
MTYSGEVYDNEPYTHRRVSKSYEAAKAGVSFGSALAIAISWSVNHSIFWAIIDGFLSWVYVIWYAITR